MCHVKSPTRVRKRREAISRQLAEGVEELRTGNVALLKEPSVSMCGSRDASPEGLEAAAIAGRTVAASGLAIVSGNARGVDIETHVAAIAAGGSTIIVLAEGIARFRLKRALSDAGVRPGSLLVLSPCPPVGTVA